MRRQVVSEKFVDSREGSAPSPVGGATSARLMSCRPLLVFNLKDALWALHQFEPVDRLSGGDLKDKKLKIRFGESLKNIILTWNKVSDIKKEVW